MLLMKYLVQDYNNLDVETRCDIYNVVKQGLQEGILSALHVRALLLYIYGYSPDEINIQLNITGAIDYLLSTLAYLEQKTHMSDYATIIKYKGEVRVQWIAKANHIALTEW